VQQCLIHGLVLPEFSDRQFAVKVKQFMRPEWVSATAVAQLEHLGLDQAGQDTILSWLLTGKVALPDTVPEPNTALFALREFLQPSRVLSVEDIACVSESLYRYHHRLYPMAGQPWLDCLGALAQLPLPNLPSLAELLKQNLGAQWLLLDCFGLPLVGPVKSLIDEIFGAWQPAQLNFAQVGMGTSTDSCYRGLLDENVRHSFQKCDVIDRIIHSKKLAFEDIVSLVTTELGIALKPITKRLESNQKVVIFADHGFRLSVNGRHYQHGTGSTLERIIPFLVLAARH